MSEQPLAKALTTRSHHRRCRRVCAQRGAHHSSGADDGSRRVSLRLSNSAHIDEALYLITGHGQLAGDPAFTDPAAFFSGSPQLYPVLAASIDSLTGLWGVRALSGLCMLGATVAVWSLTRSLFPGPYQRRIALLASALFAFSAPVLFLGHFATFDAPSFCAMAWAAAVTASSARRGRSWGWSVLAVALLATAVLLKYSSAIDAPVVVLLTLLGWAPGTRVRTLVRTAAIGLGALALLAISVTTWAAGNLSGLLRTTLQRKVDTPRSPLSLLGEVGGWAGVTLALALLGGLLLARRAPLSATLLLLGTAAAMFVQIRSGEGVSLHKHLTLGLIFAAPLGGWLLHRLGSRSGPRRPLFATLSAAALWIATVRASISPVRSTPPGPTPPH